MSSINVSIIKPSGKNLQSVCLHVGLYFVLNEPCTTYLKAFIFFKGVYTDDWMAPWVVVREVFLAFMFPNLIVSLITEQ